MNFFVGVFMNHFVHVCRCLRASMHVYACWRGRRGRWCGGWWWGVVACGCACVLWLGACIGRGVCAYMCARGACMFFVHVDLCMHLCVVMFSYHSCDLFSVGAFV